MRDILIDNKTIGVGHPVFIIAELGYNFTSTEEALESVDAAADCGVDAIKVQTFKAETITSRIVDFPSEAGGSNQFEEFREFEISEDVHRLIQERANKRGLVFFSTPSYRDDVDLLERLNVPVHKLGSDDLTNLPLIEYVASTGKPIIFSSGMATLAEVDTAVSAYRNAGNDDLILLQCVSNYPLEDLRQLDLNVLENYRRTFSLHVGLSDHTRGTTAAIAAVALGARVIEKHFALDKQMPVPDAFFSADPTEMRDLVQAIRNVEVMLGDGYKHPVDTEWAMRSDTRKSIIARRAIAAGDRLIEDDLIIKRPGFGIAPADWATVVGRIARVDIAEDTPITWEMV